MREQGAAATAATALQLYPVRGDVTSIAMRLPRPLFQIWIALVVLAPGCADSSFLCKR
jgi:hypothetical protein